MWFDDASLLCLEEADWKIGNDQGELSVTICDQGFLDTVRSDEPWCGAPEVSSSVHECT